MAIDADTTYDSVKMEPMFGRPDEGWQDVHIAKATEGKDKKLTLTCWSLNNNKKFQMKYNMTKTTNVNIIRGLGAALTGKVLVPKAGTYDGTVVQMEIWTSQWTLTDESGQETEDPNPDHYNVICFSFRTSPLEIIATFGREDQYYKE